MAQFTFLVGVAFWVAAVVGGSVLAAAAGALTTVLAVFVLWIEAAYVAPRLLHNQQREKIDT